MFFHIIESSPSGAPFSPLPLITEKLAGLFQLRCLTEINIRDFELTTKKLWNRWDRVSIGYQNMCFQRVPECLEIKMRPPHLWRSHLNCCQHTLTLRYHLVVLTNFSFIVLLDAQHNYYKRVECIIHQHLAESTQKSFQSFFPSPSLLEDRWCASNFIAVILPHQSAVLLGTIFRDYKTAQVFECSCAKCAQFTHERRPVWYIEFRDEICRQEDKYIFNNTVLKKGSFHFPAVLLSA